MFLLSLLVHLFCCCLEHLSLSLCLCVCVNACLDHACGGHRKTARVLFNHLSFWAFRQTISLNLIKRGWLTIRLEGFSWLYLLNLWITNCVGSFRGCCPFDLGSLMLTCQILYPLLQSHLVNSPPFSFTEAGNKNIFTSFCLESFYYTGHVKWCRQKLLSCLVPQPFSPQKTLKNLY